MPGFDPFDLLAPLYDRLMPPPERDQLEAIVQLPTSGRLLDAGGGTGRVAQAFAGTARLVVVADASLKMLAKAKAKESLEAVGSRTEALPFPDGSFERVLVVDAFHHLEDQTTSLAELWRMVAPGGLLVIEEPDITRGPVRVLAWAERMLLMRSRFIPAERIAAALAASGARSRVQRAGHTAWAIASKAPANAD
jgi:demethylmenaquinone methyltransferase/2-methoxy-6-polyprenyl-1,4-benzoquinol methylase